MALATGSYALLPAFYYALSMGEGRRRQGNEKAPDSILYDRNWGLLKLIYVSPTLFFAHTLG